MTRRRRRRAGADQRDRGHCQLVGKHVSEVGKSLAAAGKQFRTHPLDSGPYWVVQVDALTVEVRMGGRIVIAQGLIAVGVNADGYRGILGFGVSSPEDGALASAFRQPGRPPA